MLLSLEPRGQQSRLMLWCSPLLAAALTLGCGSLLFIALGHDPAVDGGVHLRRRASR